MPDAQRNRRHPTPESLIESMGCEEIVDLLRELGLAVRLVDAAAFRQVVARTGSVEQAFAFIERATQHRRAA